jgi:hypothetical protein
MTKWWQLADNGQQNAEDAFSAIYGLKSAFRRLFW